MLVYMPVASWGEASVTYGLLAVKFDKIMLSRIKKVAGIAKRNGFHRIVTLQPVMVLGKFSLIANRLSDQGKVEGLLSGDLDFASDDRKGITLIRTSTQEMSVSLGGKKTLSFEIDTKDCVEFTEGVLVKLKTIQDYFNKGTQVLVLGYGGKPAWR
jgi:hypothetical protein